MSKGKPLTRTAWDWPLINEAPRQSTGPRMETRHSRLHQNRSMTRVLVDCTKTYFFADGTGIQRVVEEICRHSAKAADVNDCVCLPVFFDGQKFVVPPSNSADAPFMVRSLARGFRRAFKLAAKWRRQRSNSRFDDIEVGTKGAVAPPRNANLEQRIAAGLYWNLTRVTEFLSSASCVPAEPQTGDILLLPDATWGNMVPRETYSKLRDQGVRLVPLIHDLLPLREPTTFDKSFVDRFGDWLRWMIRHSDAILTNSETTRKDVEIYLRQHKVRPIPARSFRLGCNPPESSSRPRSIVQSQLQRQIAGRRFFCLGTIEPRKNHALILEVFDKLWQQHDVELVIAGKAGWKCEGLIKSMYAHPEYRRRLHVHHDLNDAEVEIACRHCDALISASLAEGLGLPVIEGLQRGLTVFASRIPAHEEAGGDFCHYFSPHSPDELTTVLTSFLTGQLPSAQQPAVKFCWPTWHDSVIEMLDVISDLVQEPQGGEPHSLGAVA